MRISHVLPFALVCLVGCSHGPSLVGKWSVSAGGKAPAGAKLGMEFTSSNFTQTMDMEQMGVKIHVDTSGTYTFDGKKLKMTVTDMKLDDSQIPAAYKEAAKTAFATQASTAKGKTDEIDVKLEGDTASFTQKGTTATLTRIK